MKRIFTILILILSAFFSLAAKAQSMDEVRAHFAEQVYRAAPTQVHYEAPQAMLRAVVVVRVRLGEDGHWLAEVLRDNDQQPELTRQALATVPLVPVPDDLSPEANTELHWKGFVEAWLFQTDGHFALKTLAKPQRGV